ncbi:hypothetical protein Bra5_PD00133 (plasmid) [Rhizobium phaseoli Brasil 5]|nr:hypothetical protein Bra5_PD00133 [Rhizobium phaseoli Brasil 5]
MREGDNSPLPVQVPKPQRWRRRQSSGKKRRSEQKGTTGRVAAPSSERAYSCVQNPLIFPGL